MNTDKDSNNELADWLLLGSRNIDRMIDDLHQLTSMLIGTIVPTLEFVPNDIEIKTSKGIKWIIVFFKEDTKAKPNMVIWGFVPNEINSVFESSWRHDQTDRRYIGSLYEQRGMLVKGLLSSFPFLTHNLVHFIEASKVKFPD